MTHSDPTDIFDDASSNNLVTFPVNTVFTWIREILDLITIALRENKDLPLSTEEREDIITTLNDFVTAISSKLALTPEEYVSNKVKPAQAAFIKMYSEHMYEHFINVMRLLANYSRNPNKNDRIYKFTPEFVTLKTKLAKLRKLLASIDLTTV
jgi:hypothetical protein